MTRTLQARPHAWKLKEPFAISRGVRDQARVLIVELHEDGKRGRGEACGVPYHGETPETMLAQVEQARAAIEAGCDRHGLLAVLPAGGARHAVDAALWDLEAKLSGVPVWRRANAPRWEAVFLSWARDSSGLGMASPAGEVGVFPWREYKAAGEMREGESAERSFMRSQKRGTVGPLYERAIGRRFTEPAYRRPAGAGRERAIVRQAFPRRAMSKK